jgi:hypothetical protein
MPERAIKGVVGKLVLSHNNSGKKHFWFPFEGVREMTSHLLVE